MRYFKIFLFLCLPLLAFAQQATDYFPATNGFKWYTKTAILDSLNREIDSLTTFSIDSLAGETTYKGFQSKYILGKTGIYLTVPFQPYIDTSYVSLQGTEGRTYFGIGNLSSLLGLADTTLLDSNLAGFLGLLSSLEGWYSTYKFANSLNSNYTLFQKDTNITIDSVSVPLRFQVRAKRVADGPVSTEIGDFNCKKFVLSYSVSYILIPILPITLISIPDTHYVAPGNWVVKTFAPSSRLDLSVIGQGSFTFPGRFEVVILPISPVSVEDENSGEIRGFELLQNFPNPFNPVTTIKFFIPKDAAVTLKVYDNLGNEVSVLLNEYRQAGEHRISFDGTNLSSGVYFYRLEAAGTSKTGRMVLLK